MARFITALLLTLAFAAPAGARTVSLPKEQPVMIAALPDDWKPADTNAGAEGQSPDGNIYVSVEFAHDMKTDFPTIMAANGAWMTENQIVPDSSDSHDSDLTINGMAAHEIKYDAHDKDGPTNVIFTVYELPNGALALVTVWGSTEDRAAHDAEIQSVLASVKPIP